ncbi:hypothetical protein M427DRAFT_411188 [Gonapodya prolifera JEL478]|uniref:Uncharacterized protein n=1 Tax=Gonapodya prolifera (strain JEL478) TaxID=1344416 RepID=A0A139A660_GONPJ|nr:hypothetical protein M427DRAFT_411188 [Gonapodya prolifera JEL478]|eukprot:KXS12139.1 hypothetical protein M427DRAFT_411188 [Gonapodya prolifera JEL478]
MPATFDFSAFDRILEAAQTSASTAIQQHKADVETELGRLEARATSIETLCDAANFASEQLAEVHHGLHEETAGTLTKLQAFGVQAHSYLANLTALTELVLTKLRRKRNQLELDATEAARMGLASRYKRLVDVEGKELDREVAEGERLWRRYTDIMRELAGVTKEKDARKEVGERGKEYSQGSSKQGSEESTQPEVYPVEILSPMRSSGLPGSSSRPVQLLPLHIADSDDAGSAASVEDRNTQDSPVAAEPRMVDLNLHVEVALSAVDDEETQPYERAATEEEGSEAGLASLSEGSFERIEMEDVEALGL